MDFNACDLRKVSLFVVVTVGMFLSAGELYAKKKHNKNTNVDFSLRAEVRNAMNQQDRVNLDSPFAQELGRGPIPPDPINAVGSNTIVTMVNSAISLWRKDTLQQTHTENTFSFFPFDAGPLGLWGDPWVVYDECAERFIAAAINFSGTIAVAISKTSDPRSGDDFYKYEYVVPEELRGFLPGDYLKIASDREALYFSWQDDANPNFISQIIVAFDIQPLLDGSSPVQIEDVFRAQVDTNGFDDADFARFLFPVQPHKRGKKGGIEKVLFVQALAESSDEVPITVVGNRLRVYQVKDVLDPVKSELVFADAEVPSFASTSDGVPQPAPVVNKTCGLIFPLEKFPVVCITGTTRNQSLWTAHTVSVQSESEEFLSLARWYEIDVSDFLTKNIVSLVQSGDVNPGNRLQTGLYPAINVDKHGNMGISFALAGELQYPAIAYTGRLKDDPKGTVRLPLQIPVDPDRYYQQNVTVRNRYGDYSGLAVDPSDHKTFWLFHEYPYPIDPNFLDANCNKFFGFGASWTTYLAAFQINSCGETFNAPQADVDTAVVLSPQKVREDEKQMAFLERRGLS